jgi:hypothetical protein
MLYDDMPIKFANEETNETTGALSFDLTVNEFSFPKKEKKEYNLTLYICLPLLVALIIFCSLYYCKRQKDKAVKSKVLTSEVKE